MTIKNLFKKTSQLLFNRWTIGSLIVLIGFIVVSNWVIISSAKQSIYNSVVKTPSGNKVALLLGTSRYRAGGTTNLYFQYRINAAVELYRIGKIKHIIVSGDNRVENYNEPKQMQIDKSFGVKEPLQAS